MDYYGRGDQFGSQQQRRVHKIDPWGRDDMSQPPPPIINPYQNMNNLQQLGENRNQDRSNNQDHGGNDYNNRAGGSNNNGGGNNERNYDNNRGRDYRDSRSDSRDRDRRDRDRYYRSRSRSRSRDRRRDLYKDIIDSDYKEDRYSDRYRRRSRSRSRDRDSYRSDYRRRSRDRRRRSTSESDSYESSHDEQKVAPPNNKIIVRGLASHLTEADINSDLINCGLKASVRLIRKSKTGASRGFAFVEFSTIDAAKHWMSTRQGQLLLQDKYKASLHYCFPKNKSGDVDATEWYCVKCGVQNFKRRETCYKCNKSKEEATRDCEGDDEVSTALTKIILLRNLDVLTTEEKVLSVLLEVAPSIVPKINKILISRDTLTQISRGICHVHFDNLVDSMNTFNTLKTLDPAFKIENRNVLVSYCIDADEKKAAILANPAIPGVEPETDATSQEGLYQQYSLADVPRLAEYSANLYATNITEQQYYIKYYTDYYTAQITNGQLTGLPTEEQLGGANNGAAVAQSAIKKQLAKDEKTKPVTATVVKSVEIPKGNDGKKYPPPNPTLYDETSGYYYDANTGLYYDAGSRYYYNNETSTFLYWDHENSTYIQANSAFQNPTMVAAMNSVNAAQTVGASDDSTQEKKKEDDEKKKKNEGGNTKDKVLHAKKIVKDMEKWAKQLNQKKDMTVAPPPAPMLSQPSQPVTKPKSAGYADVGFSILEKKERGAPELANLYAQSTTNKLVAYGSDSDDAESPSAAPANESDYVDFAKLTCNLCKRAFQSPDVLQKHLRISNLHKENLAKYNLGQSTATFPGNSGPMSRSSANMAGGGSYRDRAKERRMKYGEDESLTVNKVRERYERELERQKSTIKAAARPERLGSDNKGSKMLQKMGWSEGQGLGRSNQGRTEIIEAGVRNSTAGLGSSSAAAGPGDDYKSYIKKMMKSRYEQAGLMD